MFDGFISIKFLIAVFLPASPFILTSPLLTLEIFANLFVYCTLLVCCFGRNLPNSLFIPSSPSISNSRVGVTAEKLVGRLFCRATEFIQNFHKGEIYLIGENFVWKKFSLGKIFVTQPIFRHFSPTKGFSADIMNTFDLS